MEPCRAVRIWGLGIDRNKPVCRCAVCSLLLLSTRIAFASGIKSETQFDPLTRRGVPVEGLGIVATLQDFLELFDREWRIALVKHCVTVRADWAHLGYGIYFVLSCYG